MKFINFIKALFQYNSVNKETLEFQKYYEEQLKHLPGTNHHINMMLNSEEVKL